MEERNFKAGGNVESGRRHYDGLLLGVRVTTPNGMFRVQASLKPVTPEQRLETPNDQLLIPNLEISGRHIGTLIVGSIYRGRLIGVKDGSDVQITMPKKVCVVPIPGDEYSERGLIAHGLPKSALFLEIDTPEATPES